MSGTNVAEIIKGQTDFTGAEILTVYSKVSNTYAVYGTEERVMVQFADDEKLGSEQRLALAPLNPVRGEINGLIDGWRKTSTFRSHGNASKAKRFDRRTADALTVALQGDQAHAEELLRGVKADILEERTSIGRTEYLIVATISTVIVFFLFWLFSRSAASADSVSFGGFIAQNDIWLAVNLGCLGALFSIALGIRSRDIRTDLQRRDNVVDAILRVMIGAVSAVILFSLFKSELVSVKLGDQAVSLDGTGGKTMHAAIIIAFLAGFAERLVGDFLSTTVLAGQSATTEVAVKAAAEAKEGASEQNPRGKQAADERRAPPVIDSVSHLHDDDGSDSCVCDLDLVADESTDDVELPEASGGIEKAA
ncbi:hypothetical protein QO002_002497 [Pararhizobium capsulatum DSM 1112]|uniref:Uncharacterized protein n=1 Tax=Pararhizobium capsulatum DSM 1112 TaxID=1121113 RepID=A0ABU0BQ30_9HYPH|nr:hypothetical protein [Pararhizobium capsulatum]MDQ0320359.1 hypothetical protein [Pararhizobium capsulatum DSM 1112]